MGFKVKELKKKTPKAYELHTTQFTECVLNDTACSFAIVEMQKDDVLITFLGEETMCITKVLEDNFTLPMKTLPKELVQFGKEQMLAVMIEGLNVMVGLFHSTVLTLTASNERVQRVMYDKLNGMLISTGRRIKKTVQDQIGCASQRLEMLHQSIHLKVPAFKQTLEKTPSKRKLQISSQRNKEIVKGIQELSDAKIDSDDILVKQCVQYQHQIRELQKVAQELCRQLVKARLYNLEIEQLLKDQQEYIGLLSRTISNLHAEKNGRHINRIEKRRMCHKCEENKQETQKLNQAFLLSRKSEERLLHELQNSTKFYESRIKQLELEKSILKEEQRLELRPLTHFQAIQCQTVQCDTVKCGTATQQTTHQDQVVIKTQNSGESQMNEAKTIPLKEEILWKLMETSI